MNILTTNRLHLRTLKQNDIEDIYKKIFSQKEVVEHTFGKELLNFEQAKEFIKNNCNFNNQLGLSAIIETKTQKLIGLGGVLKCNYLQEEDYEFGFILCKESWGKGYATEIGQAQIEFIKDIIKAPRVLALASPQNQASIHTIKKLGLTYLKDIKTKDGRGVREVYINNFCTT